MTNRSRPVWLKVQTGRQYHAAFVRIFHRHFPNEDTEQTAVTPQQFADFIHAVAHFAA